MYNPTYNQLELINGQNCRGQGYQKPEMAAEEAVNHASEWGIFTGSLWNQVLHLDAVDTHQHPFTYPIHHNWIQYFQLIWAKPWLGWFIIVDFFQTSC